MATLDIKFSKFDNRPWGFRLAGGSDFPEPLTVIRVSEGSLAECMGLKVGDVVVKLNDQPISDMTHGQAHEALTLAGNNFVLAVRRTEDPSKAIEGIEKKIEPYMLPIEEILLCPVDEKREVTPDEVSRVEEPPEASEDEGQVEEYPEKPRDINSDPLPKTDLTEEEIAQLILDEEEVLNDKGVLGVNFKKIRPRAPLLKQSEVFRELQNEIAAEPEEVQERKRQSTFLKKPDRPAPKPKLAQEESEAEVEPYRVVIKKQPKRPITERLLQKGLLDPSRATTPDTVSSFAIADTISEVNGHTCTATWSFTSHSTEPSASEPDMLPISEGVEDVSPPASPLFDHELPLAEPNPEPEPRPPKSPASVREEPVVAENAITPEKPTEEPFGPTVAPRRSAKKQRLCRRGRYAKRCLGRALDSLKSSPESKTKPRLLRRARYFERLVGDIKSSFGGAAQRRTSCSEEQSLLNVLMFASLACSLRDTYDTEILHRGSSRRNSRRMSSCRRDSSTLPLYEPGSGSFFSFSRKSSLQGESLKSFQIRYAEGRRRLSVMSMMVADKVSNAMRTDLARGLAYAMVPCASALAFFMFNYAKRYNNVEHHDANLYFMFIKHFTSHLKIRIPSSNFILNKTTPAATPEPTIQSSDGGSRPQSVASVIEVVDQSNNPEEARRESREDQAAQPEPRVEEPANNDEKEEDKPVQVVIRRPSKAEVDVEVEVTMDRDKIKELVTTEISLERQLASVQSQLMALKQLPSEIEKHLRIVSEQLHKIMELSGVDQPQLLDKPQADETSQAEESSRQEEAQACSRRDEREQRSEAEQRKTAEEEEDKAMSEDDVEETSSSYPPHLADTEYSSSYYANLAEDNTEDDATWRSDKVEISVKSNEDDGQHRVKKYIVTYESKVVEETRRAQRPASRDHSPVDVESIKSFEADPNLSLQQQLVEEFKHRQGRKRESRDHLWQPQAKQLELTYGRRWRCPNDFFNDEMIADVLSSQAEVIRGRALGVNFKKFEKANALPNYDHLVNSSVYKMIHKMDAEPKKGIPARPPKVMAAEDIIERVNTPVCGMSSSECLGS
ncbi:uncharacterized protein LOC131672052 [Phymastichus coffea]|uniref:uncharacterized protein LOC131672052 n=1 Tax=Phymastichus coffea TaxID=108790 RepID=UPI00273C0DCB|nr:uncharacterized protein LOC131672052 [Phymastichus coffea]